MDATDEECVAAEKVRRVAAEKVRRCVPAPPYRRYGLACPLQPAHRTTRSRRVVKDRGLA